MSLIALLVILLFLAGVAWLINTKIPNLNGTIKWIINLVLVIVAVVITLNAFGVWQEVKEIQVPKI